MHELNVQALSCFLLLERKWEILSQELNTPLGSTQRILWWVSTEWIEIFSRSWKCGKWLTFCSFHDNLVAYLQGMHVYTIFFFLLLHGEHSNLLFCSAHVWKDWFHQRHMPFTSKMKVWLKVLDAFKLLNFAWINSNHKDEITDKNKASNKPLVWW